MPLLAETFDEGEHNSPLSLKGWRNYAYQGTRAWWGYTFPDYSMENQNERVAKVTAYELLNSPETNRSCEMLLVSPPLDFKKAAGKVFTFRVMGEMLADGMTDSLRLCYIAPEGEVFTVQPLTTVRFPVLADENGKWQEFHLDLSNEPVDSVFFMAFHFKSVRGRDHSAVYYIDDVSFGRTDLPVITPSTFEVQLVTTPGQGVMSELISVAAENLTQPIGLSLYGADKSHFTLSTEQLPVEGGNLVVKYDGEAGERSVFVTLNSRGAATKQIYVGASTTASTGIGSYTFASGEQLEVIDLRGRTLMRTTPESLVSRLAKLPSAVYLIKTATGKVLKFRK